MQKRVVITGMGIYSCLGKTLDEVRDALYAGKSGIVFDHTRKEMGFRSALTARIDVPDLKGVLSRSQRVYMPEQAKYAYCATVDALNSAGIDYDYLERNEVGLLYGNDSSTAPVVKAVDTMREKKDTTLCGSGAIFQSMNSTVTMNLGCIFKLKGINLTVSGACASGSHAIGLGALLIQNGLQDIVVCGGAQEVNPFSVGSFDGISAFSIRESEPWKASRPFDRDRDGLVPGGGAATVILESYESAVRRGARILAEVLGYGFSSNGDHISSPNVDGPVRSLQMAIRMAGIGIREIGYVNAHATSTRVGDANEAKAIYNVFGDRTVEVTSTKSQTGHEMWMAGASEVIYSMLMMKNGFIAGNINFENPDEDSRHLLIPAQTVEKKFDTFLSNSFGFGGTNSTLVIRNL
ncbi:MAG: beta-ketoacyl-[acyl-carrier-protein] synthase family protein [Bacteroidetes bacterium]|uniref:3-oxoacyl-[acyl-carrier-protein] synthase 1 n=1 Tax=Candidatus Cryptobacteroides intestinavium TaxID=2840766 RepID=A0A9D9HHM4_9BACT|nr:beta-ketoacyl-[acyl-carrier-protein] synthase family protein [Candidatus Cryptobacteroides intestinavium]